ncbi:MAG: MGMT family protein [Mollicutes bacterium UO1]
MKSNIKKFINKEDVYKKVKQITQGNFSTYRIIAEQLGSSKGSRAVGICLKVHGCIMDEDGCDIIVCEEVHCYRVIKSDFSVGGYLFNGNHKSDQKRILLEKEGIRFEKKRDKWFVIEEDRKKIFTFHKAAKKYVNESDPTN